MPIKMIATRTVYNADEGKEYQKGETFTVKTEKERDRFIRNRRAKVDESKRSETPRPAPREEKPAPSPVIETKVMSAEEPSAPAGTETPADPTPRRYRRSDMRSEN